MRAVPRKLPGGRALAAAFRQPAIPRRVRNRAVRLLRGEHNLSAQDEIARDRAYFAGLNLDVPIAIARNGSANADGQSVYHPDVNNLAYHVSGIPQINIIDRDGTVRLIMIGYDDANEQRLAAFIEKLLNRVRLQPD